jgi:hypothetical protein
VEDARVGVQHREGGSAGVVRGEQDPVHGGAP